jgi:PmbA protein
MNDENIALKTLEQILGMAKAAGAESADAVIFDSASLEVGVRLGKTEKLERAESTDLGLRVLIGNQQAVVSSTDHSIESLREMAERCVSMARSAPEDPWSGLADPADIAKNYPDLDLSDPREPTPEKLLAIAEEAEDAAPPLLPIVLVKASESHSIKSRSCLSSIIIQIKVWFNEC